MAVKKKKNVLPTSQHGSVVEHRPVNQEVTFGFPVRVYARLGAQFPVWGVQEAAYQ